MSVLVISFFISFLMNLWIIRSRHLHERFTADSDLVGIQKFHRLAVPRVGGIGVFLGILVAMVVRSTHTFDVGYFGLLLLACGLPAFLSGLIEDVTKRIGVKFRLICTVISAILAGYVLGSWLSSVQLFGIDNLMLTYPVLVIAITGIAVGGVANAFNIIDGYNGLAGMVAVIILTGITYVAFQVGDHLIMVSALAAIGALFGFLIWNYPRGLIFLGDGGAYLVGFWIAELSVLLTARHPEISKWFPMLLCIYPIFETLFTIYRRLILKRTHPGQPDASHLHQLVYRRLVRWSTGLDNESLLFQRNALTSPYLWLLSLLGAIPAMLFWRYHLVLKVFCFIFALTYVTIYWAIVRFNIPDYLVLSNSEKGEV